ncbi:MAG: chromosome segregation protein SMC [Proteobacteria bacterium]|nr:chromosome segregation protein SMC [Pseudomonadota bacterium]MCL2307660.1 chromosome segregation protein SMC [Pseudomonadota bacterium]
MRLTHIKLSGFKSFVDPTTIATPGQLVGIVGPNGCGKSNVIDAVRWVLGESKASALRGESMQDVIFNGAGERKPVSRASVELHFDNSAGRIGGQWGQYTELSIKRVLTRDGDSTYYINNIPVRRRDIHDLFLGTGLGPRAYAIIEQGMISRVIEAKPEELRVFLEEAAGVSKYKERRKETEGRLSDTRENLVRIEDIRHELGNQLTHLAAQARVAAEYRDYETRLKNTQHMLWYSKQQDAAKTRERCQADVGQLAVAFEAAQSEIRAIETKLEHLRDAHYAASDALHDKQGAFYAANSEVTRLEQQLAFARENETRIAQQVEHIHKQIEALTTQETQLDGEQVSLETALENALTAHEQAQQEEREAQTALPTLEAAVREAARQFSELQQKMAQLEQTVRVAETRRDNSLRTTDRLRQRREKLEAELAAMSGPGVVAVAEVEEQLAQETAEWQNQQQALTDLQQNVQTLQGQQRDALAHWQAQSKALTDHTARHQALAALQAKIGHPDLDAWLTQKGLNEAARLWQKLDVETGWEDALEAALRERLNALELDSLADVAHWLNNGDTAPKITVFSAQRSGAAHVSPSNDALYHKLRIKDSRFAPLLADMLHGVRCRDSLTQALADRADLPPGGSFVIPQGHIVTAQSVTLFAPDSELHGVIVRQRELAQLDEHIAQADAQAQEARRALDQAEEALTNAQKDEQNQRTALASQQKRCHNLELELAQLRKEAEAFSSRKAQLTHDCDEIKTLEAQEAEQRESIAAEISEAQTQLHDEMTKRESLRHTRNEADVAMARGRERVRNAENAAQEARFAERSARERMQELARRRQSLATQKTQQQSLLGQLSNEKQAIDWSPVEASLQQQLTVRADAEQALAEARNQLETLTGELRGAEEARLTAEHQLEPARVRIEDMRLKEQAAVLQEQQFTEQLTEAEADLDALPAMLKAWGRGSLNNEIDRLQKAITALGAVNLAALEELTVAEERKTYLDKQSADLTEAMTTLENAIRQIDKETRELLQQTFDIVNSNFSRLFPTLFGGGQAKLVLTGEEILDSGIQVFAQPPGKRNTSIHLLSGGEKALTATSLVFAIFQLNPAPFCLLDEVDAPLDDSNTIRFCNLVREMSAQTQFMFVTHNKLSMEMAVQLIGITMPDPGMSRVVAVDIAEAVDFAAAA